jgi:hypothetical protein
VILLSFNSREKKRKEKEPHIINFAKSIASFFSDKVNISIISNKKPDTLLSDARTLVTPKLSDCNQKIENDVKRSAINNLK